MQWCGSGVMVPVSPMELQLGRTSTKVHRCSETVKTLRQVHHDAEPVFVGAASRDSNAPASASASTASCGPIIPVLSATPMASMSATQPCPQGSAPQLRQTRNYAGPGHPACRRGWPFALSRHSEEPPWRTLPARHYRDSARTLFGCVDAFTSIAAASTRQRAEPKVFHGL